MPKGHLYFIGLGLYDTTDISVKGMQILKRCDRVFAEFYTAQLGGFDQEAFEQEIGKKVQVLNRSEVESGTMILEVAVHERVGFLVCGDPMMATTHVDLRIQAMKRKIQTTIIHNSSIITAVPGLLGLQNYKFGRTTTLAYPEGEYFATSPYDVIQENMSLGMHTLILLDIQADNKQYMTANEGLELLLRMEREKKRGILTNDTVACVVARAGSEKPIIAANTIKDLLKQEFGPPLHTLVIPGKVHFMELDALQTIAQLPSSLASRLE